MSAVDTRIVKMVFDNADFASKIGPTIASLTQLNKATDQVASNNSSGLSAIGKAFEQAEIASTKAGFHIQDVWLKVASIFEYQIAGRIVSAAKNLTKSLTIDPIFSGFKEYETQMDSVQTIMANTGLEGSEGLKKVNATLDELNTYADKTIYNFTQMTKNIGTFTAAGLDLETSAKSIQGIANLAAVSGSTSQQASTAMYQLSQALASGTVKLQDWNSVVNAGMGGKVFQNALIKTAAMMDGYGDKIDEWQKQHVDKYGSFRESLTRGAWLTSDVLAQTLTQFTMSAEENSLEWRKYMKELQDMGYTEEAARDILKMANTATDAATKVKTFTQLIDTLQEAVGSGWSQTFRTLFGDFEEAKELWTNVSVVLGDIIEKQSKQRNDMLTAWKELGGRKDLITALGNAFNFLMDVIEPVSAALKQVFPPTTGRQLANITKAIKDFSEKLKVDLPTFRNILAIARGFFSIFDIGIKAVKAFFKVFMPTSNPFEGFGNSILTAGRKVGDFITDLDRKLTTTKAFEKFFQSIKDNLQPVFDVILSGGKGLLTILSTIFSSIGKAAGPVTSVGGILKNVFEGITKGIGDIFNGVKKLSPVFQGLMTLAKGVGTVIGQVFKQLGDTLSGTAFGGNAFGGLTNLFNALLSGGIMYKIFSSVKTFSSLGEILETFGDTLNAFQKKIGAEALMNTAKAIAILAGSLLLIAMIDSNKLAGATTAITIMIGSLAGAMALLMKAVNSFSTANVEGTFSIFGKKLFGINATKLLETAVILESVSKALISMGAAILMMSVGLRIVASAAEGGHLWDSFAVISLMLAELTGVAIVLSRFGGKATKGAESLKGMGTALIMLSAALAIVAKVAEGGHAWEALGIITIMLAELTGIVLAIEKFGKKKLTGMTGLISMAVSLNLVVFALKSVSDALGTEGNHIWESLGLISIMLAELAAVVVVMGKFGGFAALGGVGAIMAATSLLIMVQALKQISDALGQTDQHIWQGLAVIGAALIVLGLGLTAMTATIPGAAALLIASAALVVLGGALKIMGSLSVGEIAKSLITLAGALTLLTVGLTLMIIALPGAIALTVAAAGLTVLAGALKIFGSMKLGEILKSLLLLSVALTAIATVTTVLSLSAPFMLAFSIALVAFGASLSVAGVGMTVFSAGLQALVAVIPLGTQALEFLANAMLELIPVAIEALMDGLGVLAAKIVEYGPTFKDAAVAIIDMILMALVESQIKFGEAVLTLILGILQVLTENIPLIAQAGTDLMIAYMQAISNEIPRVVDEAYKCAIALINGLADAIEENNTELIAAVDHLMDAALQAIMQWIVEFSLIGYLMPEEMKSGIMDGSFNVKDAFESLVKDAVEAIKKKFDDFKEAAEHLLGGFIEGLKGTKLGQAVSAAAEFGSKVVAGLNSKKGLDENSPSKKGIKSGEYLMDGVTIGMENELPEAITTATNGGGDIAEALTIPIEDGSTKASGALEVLTDALLTNGKAIGENSGKAKENNDIISKLTGAYEKITGETKENTVEVTRNEEALKRSHGKAELVYEQMEETLKMEKALTEATDDNTDSTKKNTKAVNDNATATGKAGTSTKNYKDLMEEASGVVDAFTKNYGHLYSQLGEDAPVKVATFAIRNLAEATYNASLKAKDATEENKKTKNSIEDMVKSFTDMKKKIYDSVKSIFEGDSFFQKFEVKASMSMQEMLDNMRSNINGVANWTAQLNELGTKGLDQGLLKQLAELGPKSGEYVNAFSTATAEQIKEANELFAQAGQLPESASNSVVASYAMAGLNAVAGFANGIDENTYRALESIDMLAKDSLERFMTGLEEKSPSRATFRDGRYLDEGLANGVRSYDFYPKRAVVELADGIKRVLDTNMSPDFFKSYGANIGIGLASGIASEESMNAVKNAAKALSEAAASVTTKFNAIHSPSGLYEGFGIRIGQGLGIGMDKSKVFAQRGALALSEGIMNTLSAISEYAEDSMEIHPVISPVLDLTSLRQNANTINTLFPSQSLALASAIGVGRSSQSSTENNDAMPVAGAQINFTQNNYSPKALSRIDIYRQTKNQISMMKGVVGNA